MKRLTLLFLTVLLFCGIINREMEAKEPFDEGFAASERIEIHGAIDDSTSAIKEYTRDAEAYFNRGLARRRIKDYEGSMADFSKALELRPNDSYSMKLLEDTRKQMNGTR
jgi:tetratricopeptide (TPR) repeat protein